VVDQLAGASGNFKDLWDGSGAGRAAGALDGDGLLGQIVSESCGAKNRGRQPGGIAGIFRGLTAQFQFGGMVAKRGFGVHGRNCGELRFGAGSHGEQAAEIPASVSGGHQSEEGSDDDTLPEFDGFGMFGHSSCFSSYWNFRGFIWLERLFQAGVAQGDGHGL